MGVISESNADIEQTQVAGKAHFHLAVTYVQDRSRHVHDHGHTELAFVTRSRQLGRGPYRHHHSQLAQCGIRDVVKVRHLLAQHRADDGARRNPTESIEHRPGYLPLEAYDGGNVLGSEGLGRIFYGLGLQGVS